jgi:hypothetical protein
MIKLHNISIMISKRNNKREFGRKLVDLMGEMTAKGMDGIR